MTDQSSLLPPSDGTFSAGTPSGLTPGTRSEAEAALALNSSNQTDSAAPDPSLFLSYLDAGKGNQGQGDDGITEAQKAYRRPGVPRTSSYNYENALRRAQQSSVSSDLSTNTEATDSVTGSGVVASPPSATVPFPPPGQGVVPLNYGHVGASQCDTLKKSRSRGLSLGSLARQQSWNEEDFKHVYSTKLMEETKNDAGYGSGAENKAQGP